MGEKKRRVEITAERFDAAFEANDPAAHVAAFLIRLEAMEKFELPPLVQLWIRDALASFGVDRDGQQP